MPVIGSVRAVEGRGRGIRWVFVFEEGVIMEAIVGVMMVMMVMIDGDDGDDDDDDDYHHFGCGGDDDDVFPPFEQDLYF